MLISNAYLLIFAVNWVWDSLFQAGFQEFLELPGWGFMLSTFAKDNLILHFSKLFSILPNIPTAVEYFELVDTHQRHLWEIGCSFAVFGRPGAAYSNGDASRGRSLHAVPNCKAGKSNKGKTIEVTHRYLREIDSSLAVVGKSAAAYSNGTASSSRSLHWPHMQCQSAFYCGGQHN